MNTGELTELIPGVLSAAQEAGALLTGYFHRIDAKQIETKSSPVDLVSIADQEAESLLRKRLGGILPSAGFTGEEFGADDLPHDLQWVVDPLDGTSNYLAGVPVWAVSIALCDAQLAPQLGVIHAPLLGMLWHAVRGGGAWQGRNNSVKRVNVRNEPPGGGIQNSMLATGFPYDIKGELGQVNINYFCHMQRAFHKIRRLGSAAIDLAYVADGTFDGMWELALCPWDTAAGCLLIEEAGGTVQRICGERYTPGDPDILAAATPGLVQAMRLNLRSVDGCPFAKRV